MTEIVITAIEPGVYGVEVRVPEVFALGDPYRVTNVCEGNT